MREIIIQVTKLKLIIKQYQAEYVFISNRLDQCTSVFKIFPQYS